MKQGRTEKAVFAKLSTEKVELSIMGDLRENLNILENFLNQFEKFDKEYKQLADEMREAMSLVAKVEPKLYDSFDNLRSLEEGLESKRRLMLRYYEEVFYKADELGMKIPDQIDKKVLKADTQAEKVIKYLKTLPNKLPKAKTF